jgi:hypothetical protein
LGRETCIHFGRQTLPGERIDHTQHTNVASGGKNITRDSAPAAVIRRAGSAYASSASGTDPIRGTPTTDACRFTRSLWRSISTCNLR